MGRYSWTKQVDFVEWEGFVGGIEALCWLSSACLETSRAAPHPQNDHR